MFCLEIEIIENVHPEAKSKKQKLSSVDSAALFFASAILVYLQLLISSDGFSSVSTLAPPDGVPADLS